MKRFYYKMAQLSRENSENWWNWWKLVPVTGGKTSTA